MSTGSTKGQTTQVSFVEEKKMEDEAPPVKQYRKVPKRRGSKSKSTPEAPSTSVSPKTRRKEPKKGLLANFGKRLSRLAGEKQRSSKGHTKLVDNGGGDDDEEEAPVEEDPVIQIFESRNTQRVRFALEGVEPSESDGEIAKAGHSDGKTTKGTNLKQFMSKAIFGSKSSEKLDEEMQAEVASLGGSLVWESAETPTGPEVIHTSKQVDTGSAELMVSFTEDPKARSAVSKLLSKARKAEHIHFRYEYSVKCYLKALEILKRAKYPDDHPTVTKTVGLLNTAHHVLSSYNNSANIVKMGIKYEDSGELVRALKMYTIAYRIRRDNLSRNHPSLVVLLNMLGSIQIKRGELHEAMQIYELALKDSPVIFNADEDDAEAEAPTANLLAKSVTFREMGVIYERWGKVEEALNIYHKSLECITEWKEAVKGDSYPTNDGQEIKGSTSLDYSISNLQLAPAVGDKSGNDDGEMEIYIGSKKSLGVGISKNKGNPYESFFPSHLDLELARSKGSKPPSESDKSRQDNHADMDLALTLHQIAQLHRSHGEFPEALDAYEVALRGMKYALGKHHPNVAAVLGNIGNLQKEMGDLDAAYTTYQEVLGIESYRLGLSHPDVAITLHNIATIDAARGNYDHSLQLYRKVMDLQKTLFGEDHLSVSVAATCMGDVYEKLGRYSNAMEAYEEAVRIKSAALGRHALDVARCLHKLGKLAFLCKDFHMAESFLSRAVLIYRLNKLEDEHDWMVEADRDAADTDAALAMGRGRQFEC